MGAADTKRSVRAPSSPPLRTGSGSSTILNVFARIVAWYLLYTVLFVCPDVPTNDSPTICHTSHTVSTTLRPHLEPYYNQYLEPYVTEYSPWVKKTNEKYLVPTYDKVTNSYKQYAAPHVASTRNFVANKYDSAVKPRVGKVSAKSKFYYDEYLSAQVSKAIKFYGIAQPFIESSRAKLEGAYRNTVVPAYEKALPHVALAYDKTKHVVLTRVAPLVRENGEKAVYWGIGIWSDVVRPQVGRIGERLGGTGNGTPAVSVPGSPFSSLTNLDAAKGAEASSSLNSMILCASEKAASARSSAASSASQAEQASADNSKNPSPEEVHKLVEEDLARYTQKFKDSAAKASNDLNTQIDEISTKGKGKKASYAEKEIDALQKLVEKEFNKIKKVTLKLVSRLNPGSDAEEKQAALDSLLTTTKEAGLKIRDKAQEQRLESQKYLASIYDDVAAAADNHLEAFDSVRDLSMQELGMKWAWMDHVSYKDWRRYHALKDDFEGLKREIVATAQKNQKLIEVTRWVEGEWEGMATNIAKDAAEELKRLKRVSKRKIELADSSDDFSEISTLPVIVEKTGQQVLKKVEEVKGAVIPEAKEKGALEKAADKVSAAVVGTEKPVAGAASEKMGSAAGAASEKIYGTQPNAFEKAATAIGNALPGKEESTPLASVVKAHVPGGVYAGYVGASRVEYEYDPEEEETLGEKVSGIIDAVNGKLVDASRAVSEALAGATTTQAVGEKYSSIASEKYDSALSAASGALYGTPQPAGESIVSIATDRYSAAVAAASSVIYGTPTPRIELFASQAQAAYERSQTVAKDEYRKAMRKAATMVYPEDLPHKDSAASAAKEAYNEALTSAEAQYSSLLKEASKVHSRYDSVASEARASYDSALSAASTAIYGTPQPASESILSVAKEKYQQALNEAQITYDSWYSVASTAVLPPPTPTFEIISSRLSQSAESIASAASSVVYGTPQLFTESVASVAGEYASAVTDSAEERLESVKAFVSELVSGKEPAYTESVMSRFSSLMYGTDAPIFSRATSAAGEAYESASSMVSDNFESATSAVGSMMTPPPALESIISAANEQVQAAITMASEQVYGTPQGTAESVTSVIGEAYGSAASQISEAIYGRQTGAFESATLRMQEAAESAQRAISEAVYGTSKGTFESATSAFAESVDTATSVLGENLAAATEAVAEGIDAVGSSIGESYEQAQARISAAIYGPQQGVIESAQSRISEAVESAKSSLSEVVYGTQTGYVEQAASSLSEAVYGTQTGYAEQAASSVSSAASAATEKVKDAYSTIRDEL
ncbi:uncharacterized protein LAJ45_02749 [Morchella importuna]|uniref:uncharacterized protein n=1 Tax=Morchella importuna TaxID=1174673 RepID=UPI001E8D878E|nr:uncharacterized protein LAJ45_02749 [Morchella importuna]KAH8153162.1 hypothetical protein LAJ45_02749 [Morchella importuna]